MLPKLTSVAAHEYLARLISLDAAPPDAEVVGVARSLEYGLQIVISVTKYEGPARFFPAVPRTSDLPSVQPAARLTPLQRRIIAVLTGQPIRKADWISVKLGRRACDGGFRALLARMVRAGLLVKGEDNWGYRLP